jgi:hypothetical protein
MKKPIKIKPPVKKELELVKTPKSESEKGLVSIGFDDVKQPIQSIKKPKKAFQKLPKSEIPQQKSVPLPKSASFPTISNDFVAEELKEIKAHIDVEHLSTPHVKEHIVEPIPKPIVSQPHSDMNIDDLEKEIQEKMRLLEQRKIEEAERRLIEEVEKIRQEKEKVLKEEEEKRLKEEEEEKKKQEEAIEPLVEDKSINGLKLNPYEDFSIRICPFCSKKLKRMKVNRNGLMLIQQVKCKNLDCNFEREIAFSL